MNKFYRDTFLARREYYTFRKKYKLSRKEIVAKIYEYQEHQCLLRHSFNYWVRAACSELVYQLYGELVE